MAEAQNQQVRFLCYIPALVRTLHYDAPKTGHAYSLSIYSLHFLGRPVTKITRILYTSSRGNADNDNIHFPAGSDDVAFEEHKLEKKYVVTLRRNLRPC